MLVRLLALAALLFVLWRLFRGAMGLRSAKLGREGERRALEAGGRRVVAEIPTEEGVVFFVEGADGFAWGSETVARADLAAARLLLNGAVVASASAPGVSLPEPAPDAEDDGRESWGVALHLRGGASRLIDCGRLREGVSRDAARQVYEAVRAAVTQRRS